MDLLAKLIHRLTYDRIAYEPIREDFISWYLRAYHDRSIDEELDWDNGDLIDMVHESRTEAITFEPDTPLNSAIDVAGEIKNLAGFISAILTLLGISVGGLLVWLGLGAGLLDSGSVLSYLVSGAGSLLIIVPGTALPAYVVLKHTVETNEELIRLYNQELVVPTRRVRENERYRDKLTAFYIWHSSLCSTTKLVPVLFLGVLRAISPRTYGIISNRLKQDIGEYFDRNFRQIVRLETDRVQKDVKRVFSD